MLIGIDPILSPELLYILRAMGHGDELVIADANFPANSCAREVVRLDGLDAPRVLQAVLSIMPLDSYDEAPANTMQVIGDVNSTPPVVGLFQDIITKMADNPVSLGSIERFAFYERTKGAFAVIQTGERRLYGNIILKKGVLRPN